MSLKSVQENKTFKIDYSLKLEFECLQKQLAEAEQKKKSLDDELVQVKKASITNSLKPENSQKTETLIKENEHLENYIKSEYYRTKYEEIIPAYKMYTEQLLLELQYMKRSKKEFEDEKKRANDICNTLRTNLHVKIEIHCRI